MKYENNLQICSCTCRYALYICLPAQECQSNCYRLIALSPISYRDGSDDRLCGLVVRVLDYVSRGSGLDSQALQKKVVGLERGPLSLLSTTEELLDRKVAAPV
jgi:hypothetical protein